MTIVGDLGEMSFAQRLQWLGLAILCLSTTATAVKCFDCVGEDCVGQFCEGDYCMLSQYAPRWGSQEWGDPQTIKGCLSGNMLREDVRDHCEAFIEDGMDVFTCFCDKEYCNGPKQVRKLRIEPVKLFTCVCKGEHCEEPTCLGELCSYVINHNNKKTEQGCINASIPLIERRTAGACMMPPITGAMHHTIAQGAEDLLKTESCTCTSDYCNAKKPVTTDKERMTCATNVSANVMGLKMVSRTISCTGEFCFKVNVNSELGSMRHFSTFGCVSFAEDAELAEELNPEGCAKFQSEKVLVEACFRTTDKEALARAHANKQTKHKLVTAPPETRRHTTEKQYELEPAPPIPVEAEEEEKEKEEEEEEREEKAPKHSRHREKSGKEEGREKETESYIFQGPTEAPIPEDSNTTLVAVFVVIMIIIVIAGVIWKFELHKKVFRANYDTVAGG